MEKYRSIEDTISENEFTMRMQSISSKPEDDSPGDSESDTGAEFEMGLEYLPDGINDFEFPAEEVFRHPIRKIPEGAIAISYE